jgi:hypothetical protein
MEQPDEMILQPKNLNQEQSKPGSHDNKNNLSTCTFFFFFCSTSKKQCSMGQWFL